MIVIDSRIKKYQARMACVYPSSFSLRMRLASKKCPNAFTCSDTEDMDVYKELMRTLSCL